MSSAVPPVSNNKGVPKSDKAECTSTNKSTTCSVPTSGAVKHSQPIPLANKPEGKATQGTSLAGYSSTRTATSSGVATAVENGRLAAAKHNLEMLKRAQKSANPTSYSAKRGGSVLQAYFEHEKGKARKGNTQW